MLHVLCFVLCIQCYVGGVFTECYALWTPVMLCALFGVCVVLYCECCVLCVGNDVCFVVFMHVVRVLYGYDYVLSVMSMCITRFTACVLCCAFLVFLYILCVLCTCPV